MKQIRNQMIACLWISLVVLGIINRPLHALPFFFQEFQVTFVKPDADDANVKKFAELALSENGKCLICHVKGKEKSTRNPFGAALAELLDKDNFKKARLKAEPEKTKKEFHDALDKVAAQKVDSEKEDSKTFGQLIAQGELPGAAAQALADKAAAAAKKAEEEEAQAAEEQKQAEPVELATPAAGGAGGLAAQLVTHLKSELKAELRAELEPQIREQLRAELRPVLKAELKAVLKDTLKAVVMAELNAVENVPSDVEAQAIEQILQLGGSVMPLAQNDDSKTIAFHLSGTELTDDGLEKLQSVNKLVHLNLKDTQVTNDGMAHLANIITLTRLNLARTQVSDEGLRRLKGLDNIVYLNLYGSQVTDAGLEHLQGMTNLRKLYLWQSQVTEDAAKRLQEELPDCEVNY